MIATFSNRAFVILMVGGIFFNMAVGLVFALNFYVQTYFWLLNASQLSILALSTFLAVLLAFLVSPAISLRLGKKLATIVMFNVGLVISMAPLVLAFAGVMPPNGSSKLVSILFAFSAVSGMLTIGASILLISMLADVVEASEISTGRRSEGLFFAGSSLLQKVVSGFGLFAAGAVLWAVGFPDNAVPGQVDPAIVNHFIFVYVPLVLVLFVIAMAILWLFPITRESHRETLRTLAAEVGEAAPQEIT